MSISAQILSNRIRLSNSHDVAAKPESSNTIIAKYQSTRSDIAMIAVTTADGGTAYQAKIWNEKLDVGQTIPASVQSQGFGFADRKAVL